MSLVGEFRRDLVASPRQYRPATVDKRVAIVTRYLAAVDWETATPVDVERWATGLGIAPSSTADAVSHVRAFYRWANRRQLTTIDPTRYVELPRRRRRLPRPAREVDVAVALGAARNTDPSMFAVLCLMAGAGFRALEIANLQWRHVDLMTGTIRVEASKNDRDRVLEVTDTIRNALLVIDSPTVFVFWPDYVPTGRPDRVRERRAGYVDRAVNGFLHRCGLPITAHQLRHRFATVALEQCGDITLVRDLLGHTNVATTEQYAAVARGAAGRVSRAVPLPDL